MVSEEQPLSADHITRVLLQRLQSLRDCGVRDLSKPKRQFEPVLPDIANVTVAPVGERLGNDRRATSEESTSPRAQRQSTARPADAQPDPLPGSVAPVPTSLGERVQSLDTLCRQVAQCQRCDELASTRKNTVFGTGNPQARLCFLGEAPGADEDRQGEPFVGKAGQLLNKIIAACTLRREDVYILNVLKCRPPGNRTPLPDEVANCREFFEHQLDSIQPEAICCLGGVAAQSLLRTTRSVGAMRGRFHEYRSRHGSIPVLVTYHPSYLLRQPEKKRDAWEDMKLLMRHLGITVGAS